MLATGRIRFRSPTDCVCQTQMRLVRIQTSLVIFWFHVEKYKYKYFCRLIHLPQKIRRRRSAVCKLRRIFLRSHRAPPVQLRSIIRQLGISK